MDVGVALDLGGQRPQGVGAAGHHHEVEAGLGEIPGTAPADAAGGTGDDGGRSVAFVQARLLTSAAGAARAGGLGHDAARAGRNRRAKALPARVTTFTVRHATDSPDRKASDTSER